MMNSRPASLGNLLT